MIEGGETLGSWHAEVDSASGDIGLANRKALLIADATFRAVEISAGPKAELS